MDEDDRLVQVSKGVYASGSVLVNEFTVNYSYDSMGRMLRRDNGTDVTTFVWDGWDLLSETTGSVTTTYLVPDGLVWSFSRGEDVFQVHTDALGSVRVVTDSDGDVVARFEFSSWGALLPGSFDSVGLALRFVGGYGVRTDLETGLMYMRHRWYDPASQRFISRDPIGLEGGNNLYEYAKNSPLNWVDPFGLDPWQSLSRTQVARASVDYARTEFVLEISAVRNRLKIPGYIPLFLLAEERANDALVHGDRDHWKNKPFGFSWGPGGLRKEALQQLEKAGKCPDAKKTWKGLKTTEDGLYWSTRYLIHLYELTATDPKSALRKVPTSYGTVDERRWILAINAYNTDGQVDHFTIGGAGWEPQMRDTLQFAKQRYRSVP